VLSQPSRSDLNELIDALRAGKFEITSITWVRSVVGQVATIVITGPYENLEHLNLYKSDQGLLIQAGDWFATGTAAEVVAKFAEAVVGWVR
jgi:hypothetical protein